MEEGTSGVPNRQNTWETPPAINTNQGFATQAPAVSPESVNPQPVNPVVYRSSNSSPGANGKVSRFPVKKILIAIVGIFVLLTIIILIFSMFSSRGAKPATDEVTLTYWGVYEDESAVRPVITEFEQENPNIKIVYEKQDLVDYRERLAARTDNGKGPDVFRYHNTWYPSISKYLLPIPSDVIKSDDFASRYYNVTSTDLIKNGTVYGIPLYTDTLSLYINTEILNSTDSASITIPKTWQEFIDTSTALTTRDERGGIQIAGAGIGTYDNVKYAPDIISLMMAQNGVDLQNPAEYEEEIAEAIQFYTNFARVENNVWDSTKDNSLTEFAGGKLAMFFGYSWDYFTIKSQNPNIKMTVVPVPQLETDQPTNIASYWVEGVSSGTPHPTEAFLFLSFLARNETQEKLFIEAQKTRDFGEPYSIVSLSDKLKDSVAFTFADQSKTAISSPFVEVGGENNLNSDLNKFLRDAVNGVFAQGATDSNSIQTLLEGYSSTVSNINVLPN